MVLRVAPEPERLSDHAADEPVVDLKIVYCDDDIVVVDKPVGVAAHPSQDGPDRPSRTGCGPRESRWPRWALRNVKALFTGWMSVRVG